jgi:Immunity protein 8
MRPKLKHVDSHDLPSDPLRPGFKIGLEDYKPPDPDSFCLTITADIGGEEEEGADMFSFLVCTPDWVDHPSVAPGVDRVARRRAERLSRSQTEPWVGETHVWGRRVLFLRTWSYAELFGIVSDVLSQAEGSDWAAVAAQLSPYMAWEFEDHRSS